MNLKLITVIDSHNREVGSYTVEQKAIEAALEYSYDTGNSCMLQYENGCYSETRETARGGWIVGPIFAPSVGA